jgi:hypothetical protein
VDSGARALEFREEREAEYEAAEKEQKDQDNVAGVLFPLAGELLVFRMDHSDCEERVGCNKELT